MAQAVIMPKVGISVESCLIGEWKVKVGDAISVGTVLFSYETDKTEMECESTAEGTLLEIFYGDGDEVECLKNVCAIGAPGEDVSALRPDGAAAPAAETAPAAAVETPRAAAPAAATADRVSGISPRARGLAERAGVDAGLATPTGPYGRIIERDVRSLIENGVPAAAAETVAAPAAAAPVPVAEAEYEDVKFSGIRRSIAKSMLASLNGMAQLSHSFSFDATSIMAYRKLLKGLENELSVITYNDMILYAVSRTILSYPDLNANMVDDNTIRRFKHVHLGMAVDTPRGLMVPTIFNADQKSLLEIATEAKALAKACREGTISPDQLKGASFTISNLGSLNVESFTPVVNPPQVGILGVCNIQTRLKMAGGEARPYQAMGLSLTYDHRATDGAPASRFVCDLMKNLENFTALLAK